MAEKTTSFTGPIVVGLNDKKGEIRLTDGKDVNEAKYLAIKAPDVITSDTTLTFPNGAGTAGQILSTDGNGDLSWVNDSAGNPDGSNGQVQVNDNGTFGAISEGTSGQVLTSNGAGSAPTFQTASGVDPVTSSLDVNNPKTIKLNGNYPVGTSNIAMGLDALSSITSGSSMIAIGQDAFKDSTTGQYSVAVGQGAGENKTSGFGNVFVGNYAGENNGGGNSNTFIGTEAGRQNSGTRNTYIGQGAAQSGSGSFNTVVGGQAGTVVGGSRNVLIGHEAGFIVSGTNNIILGDGSTPSTNNISNEVTLGNSSISTLRCQVTSITSLSDARDKKDVEDANIGLDFINDLRPVKFVWDTRDGAKKDIKEVGFIAQELDEVQQKHGVEDHLQLVLKNNPDKLEASQGKLIPILVQAIKDLKKEIEELKKD